VSRISKTGTETHGFRSLTVQHHIFLLGNWICDFSYHPDNIENRSAGEINGEHPTFNHPEASGSKPVPGELILKPLLGADTILGNKSASGFYSI
jgi:hypothetical protein